MLWSCTLILPDSKVATGNNVGLAMNCGPNNFSVPLTNDGVNITHWGLHAWISDNAKVLIENKIYPIELSDAGISRNEYESMHDQLIYSFRVDYTDHFDSVLRVNNLEKSIIT